MEEPIIVEISDDEEADRTVVETTAAPVERATDPCLQAQMQELRDQYETLLERLVWLEEALKKPQSEGASSSLALEVKSLRKENRDLKKANERLAKRAARCERELEIMQSGVASIRKLAEPQALQQIQEMIPGNGSSDSMPATEGGKAKRQHTGSKKGKNL